MKDTYEIRLEKLMLEAINELKQIGIEPAESIKGIKVNSRAKRRLGCCKKVLDQGKIQYEIEIAKMMEVMTDRQIKEVIHHELLHTCKGCMNHGQKWKSLAAKVNKNYGYHIETTAKILGNEEQKEKRFKYEIRCTKCGNTGYRMKKSKVVSQPENYRCSKCGGKLAVKEKSFWN